MNKKFLVTLLAVMMLASLFVGCSSKAPNKPAESTAPNSNAAEGTEPAARKDPVTLNIRFFGNENGHYRDVDPAFREFEKRTQDTLNTKLNVTFTPPADYGTKHELWMTSGEDIDLFIPWSLPKFAKDGVLADLSEYFNNPKYPGLQKAFSEEYINDNKIFGKTYAIPVTNSFMDMEGVWYRKDLLKKYGMNDISSYDDLYSFLEKVKENEKDMIPFGNYGNTAFFKLFTDINAQQLEGKVFPFTGQGSPKRNFVYVQIAEDGKSVAGVAAYGDPASEWANFHPEYGLNYLMNQFNQAKRFNKFIPADTLTNTTGTGMRQAAGYMTVGGFKGKEAEQKALDPNAEIGFWPIFKNNQEMTPGTQSTDGKAWNFMAIPASSKKIERTMEFLDWVFSSQENNDLFTYGIEGKNWEAVGDKEWKVPDGVDPAKNYMFPGYQLTWNPTLIRIPAGLPEQIRQYTEYQFKPDTYQKHVLAGFTFDPEPVKNEMAKCNTVMDKYLPFLLSGFGDVEENLAKMNKDLKDSGVDKIKEELKNQINAFLAQK
ncbi:ABC transporter substrate-binding protein [Paenibacillus harenae]|uniref:Aldouronate transport system substrate-binding protein n=1 Tax=Paenibacillus harenae TaxID=306543 RepID=A0ABT9TTC3_PAEHA|nr:ABC transporter substrate-binding protein [Paenibacillus harenae]MDQ0110595.1 putative aldouronate transport system substrate-binding protein [Paenibacillus harenae]